MSGIESKSGRVIGNSSNSRPGVVLEGGSPFEPLRYIEENGTGDADVENGDPSHREHVRAISTTNGGRENRIG